MFWVSTSIRVLAKIKPFCSKKMHFLIFSAENLLTIAIWDKNQSWISFLETRSNWGFSWIIGSFWQTFLMYLHFIWIGSEFIMFVMLFLQKKDDTVFKVPKLVSGIRTPGSGGTNGVPKRAGLVRPSSGYYSLNVTAKSAQHPMGDLESDIERHSPTDVSFEVHCNHYSFERLFSFYHFYSFSAEYVFGIFITQSY